MDHVVFIRIREALEKLQFPRVVCVVVFGSWANGSATTSSDIDLLVICNGIHPKRHRRGEEIAGIKKHLPGLPVDILLLTPDEVASNFRNHNPLFLDIAEEGIILIDNHGWLGNLMDETRNYIKQRGLKKTDHGWIFPVTRGVPSYLSKVSNKDFSLAMMKDGERDYLIGRSVIDGGYYDKAVYQFQQGVEKCIKSILIAMGIFEKTHFVGEALRTHVSGTNVPEGWREDLITLSEISEGLEPEATLSRYPGII